MVHELKNDITPEHKAREIIESFRIALIKCLENKGLAQILFEVNLSPEGGISRCYLKPQYKINIGS